jgi:hypothetical protein
VDVIVGERERERERERESRESEKNTRDKKLFKSS